MKNVGFNPKFTIINRITAGLNRIEQPQEFLEVATLSEDWIREMGNRALVLEAHHTDPYRRHTAEAGTGRASVARRQRARGRPR
ncbi:MAG: hypothetical protein KAV87_06505 [Desulfobacteraceae bacterium]|nr:hypothetical protein [Desulfobacteraceae bacterium]